MQQQECALKNMQRRHDFLVGIDSDGCVFDTMELKHKECFIPNIISHWGLQSVSRFARQTAEFVNLYSRWRGINRFPALLTTFDLLARRPEVIRRGWAMPETDSLRRWVGSESRLGNPALEAVVGQTGDAVLQRTLDWSLAVNEAVEAMVSGVPPFPYVRASLERIGQVADPVVVSATPAEALLREWREHSLDDLVRVIAGQEMGSKKEHLSLASSGRYAADKILMIGDAPGDLQAARANGALFYPVKPGFEEQSWQRFYEEAFDRFLSGCYAGDYEKQLIEKFESLLPAEPPWETTACRCGGCCDSAG